MKQLLVLTLILLAACAPAAEPEIMDDEPIEEEMMDDTEEEMEEEMPEAPEDSSDWKQQLMKFTGLLPEYHVEYDTTMQSPEFNQNGAMSMYVDGDRFRVDAEYEGVESRTFLGDEEVISCTNNDGWTCMSFDLSAYSGETNYVEQASDDAVENMDDFEQVRTESRTIVGERTTCFLYNFEGSEHELCYNDKGAMLYMEMTTDDVYMKYVATSYSDSVSNADFQPPAEPQSMEDMMAGQMPDGFEMPEY